MQYKEAPHRKYLFWKLEVHGTNAPFLPATGEGWGPSDPTEGLQPPALEFKSYPYTKIAIMEKIATIAIKLTWNFLCIILRNHYIKEKI